MTTKKDTDKLLDSLCQDAKPVHCVCPWRATLVWLSLALPVALGAVAYHGFHNDMGSLIEDTLWSARTFFALATGITAIAASFCTGVPGRSPNIAFLPGFFLLAWLAALIVSIYADYQIGNENALTIRTSMTCFVSVTQYGVPLVLAMHLLMRRFRSTIPGLTSGLMAVGVFAFAEGVWQFHNHGISPLNQLIWHFGTVVFYGIIFFLLGRLLFRWYPAR